MNAVRPADQALSSPIKQAGVDHGSALVYRAHDLDRRRFSLVIVALAGVTIAVGASSLADVAAQPAAALLWPVAGVATVLTLCVRGPLWQAAPLLAAVLIAGPLLVATPLASALLIGLALTLEALLVRVLLGPSPHTWLLDSRRSLGRLLLASAAAAVCGTGLIVAGQWLLGASVTISGMLVLMSAHLAALLVVVPPVLMPLALRPRGGTPELLAQVLLTLTASLVVLVVVADLRAVVLLAPLLTWGAMRFPPILAAIQLVVIGLLGDLSVLAGTTLVSVGDEVGSILLVHSGMVALVLVVHVIAVVRIERMTQRAENDRRAELLRRGLEASRVGTVLVQPDSSAGVHIVEFNGVAEHVVEEHWFEALISAWLTSEEGSLSTEVTLDDGRTIQVQGQRVLTDDGDSVLSVQLVDVTAFVEAREAMAQAIERERQMIDRLHALARQKEEFVSAVSHELRTPLTSIVGFAEDLSDLPEDEQREATEIILRNAGRLTEMVEDLLELGRMTTPNPVRDTGSVDLSTIVSETVADQRTAAKDRRVCVEVMLSTEPAMVVSSATTLGRIATNLVSNAIKFAPEGGRVRISTRVTAESVELRVEDSGPGISVEDEPHVFERFYRSDNPDRRRTPGTGLGLSIVKSLVELLHGTVTVGGSALGGASMGVSLPRSHES